MQSALCRRSHLYCVVACVGVFFVATLRALRLSLLRVVDVNISARCLCSQSVTLCFSSFSFSFTPAFAQAATNQPTWNGTPSGFRNHVFSSTTKKTVTFISILKMDAYYNKKYKLDKSENFDEFMKALGVGLVTRKMGNAVSPVVELKQEGDEYSLSSNSTFKNVTTKFKLGVQMDDETPDGRKVKSTFTMDGATLLEKQVNADGKETSIERHFTADEIKMVCKVDDIVCTRTYKLQA